MAEKKTNTELNGRKIQLSEKAQKIAVRFYGAQAIDKTPAEVKKSLPPEIKPPVALKDLPPEIKKPPLKEVVLPDPILTPITEENPVVDLNKIEDKATEVTAPEVKPRAKRKPAKK